VLSIITLGIYSIYFAATVGRDVNTIASKYDGKRTMNYWFIGASIMILGFLFGITLVFFILSALFSTIPFDSPGMWNDFNVMDYQYYMITPNAPSLSWFAGFGIFIVAFVLAAIVLTICMSVWMYRVTKRISDELARRDLECAFSTNDFWLWYIGVWILLQVVAWFLQFPLTLIAHTGHLVFTYKLINAINMLTENYNTQME